GRATSVVIDPADGTGNTVYVGGAVGGPWRSTNAASGSAGNASGVTWTPLIDNQPTLAVGAIALQPVNATNNLSNVILVGTGEANSSGDSYYGLGILRSIDGGNNWSLISTANGGAYSFKGLSFSKIAFNSTTGNTNVVVAGVASTFAGEQEGADNLTDLPWRICRRAGPERNVRLVHGRDGHRRSESRYLAKQGRRQQLDTDQHNHYRCLRRSRLRRLRSPAG